MKLTSLHILPCSPVCFVKSFLPSILDAISFASSGLKEQQYHFKVKWSLNGLTIKSDCNQLLSVVLVYLCMRRIPHALGCRAYLLAWQKEGALCVEHLPVFHLHPHLLSTIYKCDGCLSSRASHRCSLHLGAGYQ